MPDRLTRQFGLTHRPGTVLIDTHCHLDAAEFDGDREAMIASAQSLGVGGMVVPAVERANFGAVASLCREYPACVPAYGIHPMYVDRARDDDLALVSERARQADTVAVGEIGLDRFVTPRDDDRQTRFFVEQLRIARDAGLPVLLHVRRAVDEVLKALRRIAVPGGIAHAFNGSRQQADAFIALGFKLGFGGSATFTGSRCIRALATELPLDALVLETDAPDIPPAWLAGARNSPDQLPRIARTLAELRGMPLVDLIYATTANACAVLPRLVPLTHGH